MKSADDGEVGGGVDGGEQGEAGDHQDHAADQELLPLAGRR